MQAIHNLVLHHGDLKSLLYQVIGLVARNLSLANTLSDDGHLRRERLRDQCHLILIIPEYLDRPSWHCRLKSEYASEDFIDLSTGLARGFLTLPWLNGWFVCARLLSEGKRHSGEQQTD